MNPLSKDYVKQFVRYLLIFSPMIEKMVDLTPGDIEQIVTALLSAFGVVWGVVSTYRKRKKLVTAMAMEPTTENAVEAKIKSGNAPDVKTEVHEVPQLASAAAGD